MRLSTVNRALLSLFGAMLMALMAGCGHGGAARRLAEADAVIEERPDSALRILEAIDTSTLRRERDLRLRHLLLAQARVKLDLGDVDTVPLAAARKYFFLHPEEDYRLRSNFYMGDIARDSSSFVAAIGYAADAFLEARDRRDNYWTAKSAELISHIIYNCGFRDEGLEFDSIASAEYKLSGKILNSIYSKADYAINLLGLKRYEKADRLFEEVVKELSNEFPNDSAALLYTVSPALYTKIMLEDYPGAEKLHRIILKYRHGRFDSVPDMIYSAMISTYKGDYEKSRRMLDSIEEMAQSRHEVALIAVARNELAKATNDSSSIIVTSSEIISYFNEEESFSHDNPVGIILHSRIASHDNHRVSKYRSYLSYLLIFLLFLSPFIIDLLYGLFSHRKKVNISLKEIRDLEKRLLDTENNYSEIWERLNRKSVEANSLKEAKKNYSSSLSKTVSRSMPIHNILFETLSDLNGSNQNDSTLAREMKKRAKKHLTKEYAEILSSAIRVANEKIIESFEREFPQMDRSNIQFFIFATGGLSVTAISFLTKEKITTVYSRRKRVIDFVNSSSSPEKISFLKVLDSQKKGCDRNIFDEI